jgi:hypothetical protein
MMYWSLQPAASVRDPGLAPRAPPGFSNHAMHVQVLNNHRPLFAGAPKLGSSPSLEVLALQARVIPAPAARRQGALNGVDQPIAS